jgi:hypothetical protein
MQTALLQTFFGKAEAVVSTDSARRHSADFAR